jgi:hypothetical protein
LVIAFYAFFERELKVSAQTVEVDPVLVQVG